jgi:outer membrane protein OmpA-like peptidoglycan-associated protein
VGNEWSAPRLLDIGINSEQNELAAAVSSDEKRILFTRPMPEDAKADEYCYQLWLIEQDETNQWLDPKPLEPTFNTGCICAPYFAADNVTFYYSSFEDIRDADNKSLSKKQFNVFWAKSDGFFKYSPKPLTQMIGESDMVSVSIVGDSLAYFGLGDTKSSNIKKWESQIGIKRLDEDYKPVTMRMLSGSVSDESDNQIEATIQIVDPFTSAVYQQIKTDESGYYQAFLPTDRTFSVISSAQGYSIQSKLINTTQMPEDLGFKLFETVDITFNTFDSEFYFPIETNFQFYDSAFNEIDAFQTVEGVTTIPIGDEINVIFNAENYFADTLNLPFHKEIIFSSFDFGIDLVRKLKVVDFNFTDEETGSGLELEITIYNATRDETTRRTVKDGNISLELRDGEVYEISTSAQGYSYYNSALDLSKDEDVAKVEASLQSIKNQSIVLNNIFFEVGSFELDAVSYIELDKLVTYLIDNESYKVEIAAHTDDTGGETFNLQLSNLRANSVMEYLQDQAIINDRMIAIGYGESNPLVDNTSEENRSKNRRVEFKIINEAE